MRVPPKPSKEVGEEEPGFSQSKSWNVNPMEAVQPYLWLKPVVGQKLVHQGLFTSNRGLPAKKLCLGIAC